MPDHTDRKHNPPASIAGENAFSTSLAEYSAAIVETVREPLVLLDAGLRVLAANAAFYRAFGGTRATVQRRSLYDLAEGRWDAPDLHVVLEALREQDIAFEDHEVEVIIDGMPRVYRLNARKLVSPDPESLTLLLAFEDVSERLRLEEGLRDLARMEAVGQLAGGVAHEINNQMTVLMGFITFVTRDLDERDPRMQDLRCAERAAEHVVYITRQLLNFSRKQMIRRETIDPWTVLVGMHTLLGRVLGPGIHVNIVRKGELRAVEFDAGQLSEVFLNLALNARYAMGRTGTFEIALSSVDAEEAPHGAATSRLAGRYLRFAVRDTGTGMDEKTRKRVFEPFFTTKPIGEGTGLGLASVCGAVTQNGGFISVEQARRRYHPPHRASGGAPGRKQW
jgi:PAS domain S-box-containing protein